MAAVRVMSELQREVLSWVAEGCPDGVYEGFSHRIAACALAGKRLVKIKGRGPAWQATVTEAGQQYLEHGIGAPARATTPAAAKTASTGTGSVARTGRRRGDAPPAAQTANETGSAAEPKPRKSASPTVGPVDQMMSVLRMNGDRGLLVGEDERTRYRQLAASARRCGRIPDGMQIVVDTVAGERRTRVALVPLPEWRTARLAPVPVPKRLHNPSDVVQALRDSDTFAVAGKARGRALRLIDALVTAGRDRDMRVTVAHGVRPTDRRGCTNTRSRRDDVRFTLQRDTFRLWITQGTVELPHAPTSRELQRAAKGHAFPDHDNVPDEHLGIGLDGDGGEFWASS